MAFQIAFDVSDRAPQAYVLSLQKSLSAFSSSAHVYPRDCGTEIERSREREKLIRRNEIQASALDSVCIGEIYFFVSIIFFSLFFFIFFFHFFSFFFFENIACFWEPMLAHSHTLPFSLAGTPSEHTVRLKPSLVNTYINKPLNLFVCIHTCMHACTFVSCGSMKLRSFPLFFLYRPIYTQVVQRIMQILTGELTSALFLDFLSRNNHADLQLLTATKVYIYMCVCVCLCICTFVFMCRCCKTTWRRGSGRALWKRGLFPSWLCGRHLISKHNILNPPPFTGRESTQSSLSQCNYLVQCRDACRYHQRSVFA